MKDSYEFARQPLLIVVSGQAGVGKDSLIQRMKERGHPVHFVVTATDRSPRPGEVHGKDYFFLTTAEFLQMDKGSVAHALRRLEQNGYIAREKDVGDQRISRVYLTEKAKRMRETFFSVLSSQTDVLAEGFTEQERHQALGLLRRMAENAACVLKDRAA